MSRRTKGNSGAFILSASYPDARRTSAGGVGTLLILWLWVAALPTASATQNRPAAAFRQVTDEIGRTIRIPQSIRRVVSLAPSLTETVYALGAENLLVGDTDYCDFPPDAQQKPKVGGATNPNLEAIAALHPDLVLVTVSLNRLETVQALEGLGIPSYATDPHTALGIIASTEHLADLLGTAEAGTSLANGLQHKLSELQQKLRSSPLTPVLFVVWTQPLMSIGRDTFIADALRHAGAVSIIDSPQNWPRVNLEEVVRLQPEFIIFVESHTGAAAQSGDAIADLPGWRLLHAVRERHYATISDAINRPAPRLISEIESLARQLHPEAFEANPEEEKDQASPPTKLSNSFDATSLFCSAPPESACAL